MISEEMRDFKVIVKTIVIVVVMVIVEAIDNYLNTRLSIVLRASKPLRPAPCALRTVLPLSLDTPERC